MQGDENMGSRKNARQGASKNGMERKPVPWWPGENFSRVPMLSGVAPPFDVHGPYELCGSVSAGGEINMSRAFF